MRQPATLKTVICLGLGLSVLLITACHAQSQIDRNAMSPDFDHAFWQHWGDGNAELSSYDLVYPRYGHLRNGTAVTIFVTEDFSDTLRVKADPGNHPATHVYPVMKLNLIEDFATGIYDYNLLTSVFVKADNSVLGGLPVKTSFSSQEWCGQVYAQQLFDMRDIQMTSHSYFDGEADQHHRFAIPPKGISEDNLLHWARGLATPVLKPGQTLAVRLLRSLAYCRLLHKQPSWVDATLAFDDKPVKITVPAGTFMADKLTCTLADGLTWTFYVQRDDPYRHLLKWESTAGHMGQMIQSKRLPYWKLHDPGNESYLKDLGLTPRPPRTP